ncbi:MAG: DUF1553 domain-containing protein [Akkermansiaceae bacterium]|nr:DUF1553 domain-containing protein [Akkermansiaceae bacterium]
MALVVTAGMAAMAGIGLIETSTAADTEPLNFSRDIRPILSAKCFACHGPDSQDRDADYRMDTKEGAFADLGGYHAIVPGDPENSEIIKRIISDDEDKLMPPPKHKKPTTPEEVALLKRWIAEGAPYTGHWAYESIKRPDVPEESAFSGSDHPVDQFIASQLQKKGMGFSPPAPPETLVRRLHLDLTGTPPSPEEVDAFLADPEAGYAATIDKLLGSDAFAERLASDWLDVARYADTNGYSVDDHREMWGWRDWVIQAFRNNMPYDQFIREQVAGDLLPGASVQQKVATGFLRNSMNTHEGGTIQEEYRVSAIADKIDTVSTAFLGLTVKCAQCHDHKYDPISQKDYYRFFAFFNHSSEPGMGAGGGGNTNPVIQVEPFLQDKNAFKTDCQKRIDMLEQHRLFPEIYLGKARKQWEASVLAKPETLKGIGSTFPVHSAAQLNAQFNKDPKLKGKNPSWIWFNKEGRGHVFTHFRRTFKLAKVPRSVQLFVSCDNEADIWINGHKVQGNKDWREPTVVNITKQLKKGDNLIAIRGKDWEFGAGLAALFAYMHSSDGNHLVTDSSWQAAVKAGGGWEKKAKVEGFTPAAVVAPLGKGPWGDVLARYRGLRAQSKEPILAELRKPDHLRDPSKQRQIITSFGLDNPEMSLLSRNINVEIDVLKRAITSGKTSVMIMDEGKSDRKTHILDRGEYNKPLEEVTGGVPGALGELPQGVKPNRLALANWLTDSSNPLTARVIVNRYWQMIFGTGIVKTAEDFGSQGEWPSHPELIDWLAAEFVASGWDLRKLVKLIVSSQTYRQSSRSTAELQEQDPYNRLLARSPRYRLSAEYVRDNALTIAGLLNPKVGGPSSYPIQPQGLWKQISFYAHGRWTASQFYPDTDNSGYRRSMYHFWKRTLPPPMMTTFDAGNRETCSARRSLTNTPLQSLALLNAPQYSEAAHGLAQRMIKAGDEPTGQIEHGFRLATSRQPSSQELAFLKSSYQEQISYFGHSAKKRDSYLVYGRAPLAKMSNQQKNKTAALTAVASIILNLDETITRE